MGTAMNDSLLVLRLTIAAIGGMVFVFFISAQFLAFLYCLPLFLYGLFLLYLYHRGKI